MMHGTAPLPCWWAYPKDVILHVVVLVLRRVWAYWLPGCMLQPAALCVVHGVASVRCGILEGLVTSYIAFLHVRGIQRNSGTKHSTLLPNQHSFLKADFHVLGVLSDNEVRTHIQPRNN